MRVEFTGMCDDNDYCDKRRAFDASAAIWLVISVIGLLVAFTDWLVPKILGSVALIIVAYAVVRIGIRTWRNGFK